MTDDEFGFRLPVRERDVRFDACCQLCGRVAGQLVDRVFLHHPDCVLTPLLRGRLPRCCDCGGPLIYEATSIPMSTAAEREAERRFRPGRTNRY